MGGVKKSVYIFLCSLLGVLLFLVLHRVAVLIYLLLIDYNVLQWANGYSYLQFVAIDYITLLLVMLCGSWYGIWVGSHWYEVVYESGKRSGWIAHFRDKFSLPPKRHADLKQKIQVLEQQLVKDLSEVKEIVKEIPTEILKPVAIKRKTDRKKPAIRRVTKKVNMVV